ncbi:MAG: hypothetical protein Q8N48_16170 [Thiobacillus sp.]|nr:hypothetical protein [Thiobacillus sp.]MDP2980352.1 hypothetical protein [Thiobacillus sp.]
MKKALIISADHFEDSELLFPFYRLPSSVWGTWGANAIRRRGKGMDVSMFFLALYRCLLVSASPVGAASAAMRAVARKGGAARPWRAFALCALRRIAAEAAPTGPPRDAAGYGFYRRGKT